MANKRRGEDVRLDHINGLDCCRVPDRKPAHAVAEWSKPALRVIPLTAEQLAMVRNSDNPTTALRDACMAQTHSAAATLTVAAESNGLPSGH